MCNVLKVFKKFIIIIIIIYVGSSQRSLSLIEQNKRRTGCSPTPLYPCHTDTEACDNNISLEKGGIVHRQSFSVPMGSFRYLVLAN